jgi:hypothetical protein
MLEQGMLQHFDHRPSPGRRGDEPALQKLIALEAVLDAQP